MPDKLTERVKEIREREQKATLGPWRLTDRDGRKNQGIESAEVVETDIPNYSVSSVHITAWKRAGRNAVPTADFIAHSRADIPFLLDTVERLLAERRWIPVGESSPSPEQHYVLIAKAGAWVSKGRFIQNTRRYKLVAGGDDVTNEVTHWQPNPSPPAVEAALGEGTEERT